MSPPGRREIGQVTETDLLGGLAIFRVVDRAKDDVPEENVVAVIRIGLAKIQRMMPAMKFSHAENVVQGSELQTDVAVLKEPVNGDPNAEEEENFFSHPQEQQGTQCEYEEERGVTWMKARGV